jgi:hypothetical protein
MIRRKTYIGYIGVLQGFWPIRAAERRSRDRYCTKPVGILAVCRLEECYKDFG